MKLGKFEVQKGTFYLANNWTSDLRYTSIGLSSDAEDAVFPNLISKLRSNKIIDRNTYTIEFSDKDNGVITFGTNTTMKNYTQKISMKSSKYYIVLFFNCRAIISDKGIELSKYFFDLIFDESFNYIQMASSINQTIYDLYLTELNCDLVNYSHKRTYEKKSYIYYLCSKNQIESKKHLLTDLVFVLNDGNLTLRKEDLFDVFDANRMIFNIVFIETAREPQWIIGNPILKYITIKRDLDFSIFTLYYNESDNRDYSFLKYILVVLCFILLLGICTILLIYSTFPKNNKSIV